MPAALADYEPEELGRLLAGWGFPASHAPRILRAHYGGRGLPEAASARLPAGLVDRLHREVAPGLLSVAERQVAADGTLKLLLRLGDGRLVEAVLMPGWRPDRAAACLSSQAGCAMGCDFCATGKAGFERNLSAGEMIEQFIALRREATALGRRIRTVVFMGMGEPMLNLEAVLAVTRRLADSSLGGLGWRQITVSTVGWVPGIDDLTASGLNLQLAVSLHAPDDATRSRLLPAGRRFALRDILAAVDRFQARHPRPVIVQYCLLAGVNDSAGQAGQLADLLAGRRLHVNLLRYHPTGAGLSGARYEASSEDVAEGFARILSERGVVAHFRRSRGTEIAAACGQLRSRLRIGS